jgi:molybdopterin-guanine dinucleotide biosynthesis protein A
VARGDGAAREVAKPAIPVGGIRMIDRVLAALAGAEPIVVVGPADLGLPTAVVRTREDPPGGGPVAGLGAAIELAAAPLVAILGGDLPLLAAGDLADLVGSLHPGVDGAVFVDGDDRAQWLCGVWRTDVVHARLRDFAAERGGLANGSLRGLFGPLRFAEVRAGNRVMPPFFDCDTDDDIRRAEEWLRR